VRAASAALRDRGSTLNRTTTRELKNFGLLLKQGATPVPIAWPAVRDTQIPFHGLESLFAQTSVQAPSRWKGRGSPGQVRISLDGMRGKGAIVTFRFYAGITGMRDRIYASRGMSPDRFPDDMRPGCFQVCECGFQL